MRPWKIVWLCWCGFWALAWMFVGLFTFGLGWLMVPVSLILMLIVLAPDQPRAQQVAYVPMPPIGYADIPCNYCHQPKSHHGGPWQTECPRALPPPPPIPWPQPDSAGS